MKLIKLLKCCSSDVTVEVVYGIKKWNGYSKILMDNIDKEILNKKVDHIRLNGCTMIFAYLEEDEKIAHTDEYYILKPVFDWIGNNYSKHNATFVIRKEDAKMYIDNSLQYVIKRDEMK